MEHYDDAAFAALEARCKSNTHRLDDQEKRIDNIEELTSSVKVLATREERVERDVREIKTDIKETRTDVKELTSRPARRWEGLVDKLLAALAGAFITWILTGGGTL